MDYGIGDTVYFDDFRLYPPRCMPEITGTFHHLGDFTEDCNTDYFDLDIMTTDWLKSGQWAQAAPPAFAPEVWYRFDDGTGETTIKNDGSWSGYDISITSPTGPNEPAWDTNVAPVLDPCDPNYALDFDGMSDYLSMPNSAPNQFAGTQNMSITAWVMPTRAMAEWDFPSIVESRIDVGGDDMHASGFGFGLWGELMYWWNDDYWDWRPDLWPDANTWSFVAVTVEPTKAVMYLYDANSGQLDSATHIATHDALVDWDSDYTNVIGLNPNGLPIGDYNPYFKGKIDDLRLYNKTLTIGDIMGLCGVEGLAYVPLVSGISV